MKSPRSLKALTENGQRLFTIKSQKELSVPSLCESCAQLRSFKSLDRHCPYSETEKTQRYPDIQLVEVVKCKLYQPNIAFVPPLIGFEGEFNTFRPGVAWTDRVKPGDIVGLYDSKQEIVFGKAEVTGIDGGRIQTMLNDYAHMNHLMLSEIGDFRNKLFAVLKKIYGPQIIGDASRVTVISLRRLS